MKKALRKIFWRCTFTTAELRSVLIKIEATLNSHPLLATGTGPDASILTPACFIALGTQLLVPPLEEDKNDHDFFPTSQQSVTDMISTYKKRSTALASFWSVFLKQYFSDLRD